MIATPSYDGKTTIEYNDSLFRTVVSGMFLGYQVFPMYVCGEALLPKARNTLFQIAHEQQVDDVVWIDADIGWKQEDFFNLLKHEVDVVGGTYRKKYDGREIYVFRTHKDFVLESNGLAEMEGLGTGFLRMSKKAMNEIWDYSDKYKEDDLEKANVFYLDLVNQELISEDLVFCDNWIKSGGKVYLDHTITCEHVGTKVFSGNFKEYAEKIFPPKEQ